MTDFISAILLIIIGFIAIPTVVFPLLAIIGCLIGGIAYQILRLFGLAEDN